MKPWSEWLADASAVIVPTGILTLSGGIVLARPWAILVGAGLIVVGLLLDRWGTR